MAHSSFVPHFYQPQSGWDWPRLMRVAMVGWVIGFAGSAILAYAWRLMTFPG